LLVLDANAKGLDLGARDFLEISAGDFRDTEIILEQSPVHGRLVLAINHGFEAIFGQKQRRTEAARSVSDDRYVHTFSS
jgi:hypothetical protein